MFNYILQVTLVLHNHMPSVVSKDFSMNQTTFIFGMEI